MVLPREYRTGQSTVYRNLTFVCDDSKRLQFYNPNKHNEFVLKNLQKIDSAP